MTIAVWEQPRTLREYVTILTDLEVPTRRGGAWSTGLVDRLFRSRKLTPKKLLDNVTRPLPTEPLDWPDTIYAAYGEAVRALETGRWVAVTLSEPSQTDLVRHSDHGVGQMITQTKLGQYLCSYVNEDGSFEVECRAADLETFRFDLSRQDLLAAQGRLRKRLFRPELRINMFRLPRK